MEEVVTHVMEIYPQYRLEDFFQKHGWQGGLSLPEVQTLYECALKRIREEHKFMMALHGADPDEADKNNKINRKQQQPKNQTLPIFGDPEDYEYLTQEEKEQKTQEMMQQHRQWAHKAL